MASTAPSPKSSPPADSPTSLVTSPPPPSSPSPSNSSTPPPQSPPPPVSPASPPSTPALPPQASSPPPTSSPPPPTPPSPPATSPLTPPSSPPPASSPPLSAPPPGVTSPSRPDLSTPPSSGSSPPQASPTPPAPPPPPLRAISPSSSPPPPTNVPTPPSSNSPPPPVAKSTTSTPPPTMHTPPPSESAPNTTFVSPPPSVPSLYSPPPIFSPAPPSNSSSGNLGKTSTKTGGLSTGGFVAIGIVFGILVISLAVMAMWFVHKWMKRRNRKNVCYSMPSPFASSQNSDSFFLKPYSPAPLAENDSGSDFLNTPSDPSGVSNSRSWFTYEELVQATNGFSAQNILGEGGFGCVYKGVLADGKDVAIKQLKIGGGQGEREFRAEVEIISRIHHRYLVSLVGYCISEHQRLLVYEYVPNNTLHYHLHGECPIMDWAIRMKVAAGAARGLAYLHEDCHPRIIHRDIKSSNILLDNNFEARVADFGLAKLALDSNTHVTTRVMGTFGYMAPEYATSGKLTEKSDVYSFGVVLLELITGRKPVDASQPLGDESLVEWARPLLSQALEDEDFEGLVDPRLEKNYVGKEMFRMTEAAAACVRHSAVRRPRMSLVVRALESLDELSDLTNGMKPGQSKQFDPAQQSAQIRMFQRMAFGGQEDSSEFFDRTQSSWRSGEHGYTSSANSS
ncbi:hypothetical protein I3760_04G003600 [Carya illinoinensis]|nr:hypothetical protein I3760_04G003600 [Carya illinoinensis]